MIEHTNKHTHRHTSIPTPQAEDRADPPPFRLRKQRTGMDVHKNTHTHTHTHMRGVGRRDPRAICQRREQVGALRTGHFRQVEAAAAQDARAADAGGLVLEPQELVLGLSGVDGLCDLHVEGADAVVVGRVHNRAGGIGLDHVKARR